MATGGDSEMIGDVFTWLNDPAHWRNTRLGTGIPGQLWTHVQYSGLALVIAAVIALPLGLAVGHYGRGTAIIAAANAVRALPTVGVLVLLTVIIAPHFYGKTNVGYLIPTEIVLVLLAIPPILSSTYAGIDNVSPEVRDAARGMGMTGGQVLRRVELPVSLPLIFSGFRSATLQVIATTTVASYLPLDGLGRFIYDGVRQNDFPQAIGGGVLVAALALVADLGWALAQRYAVSRGISGRYAKQPTSSTGARGSGPKRERPWPRGDRSGGGRADSGGGGTRLTTARLTPPVAPTSPRTDLIPHRPHPAPSIRIRTTSEPTPRSLPGSTT